MSMASRFRLQPSGLVRLPRAAPGLRIGLYGGSFNPAHAGHRHVAEVALRRLRLDEVWLMVSPGNPLKPVKGMAPFPDRIASARGIGSPKVKATGIEASLGTRWTFDTLRALRLRFPRVRFVWVMGADNLAQLPRWQHWMGIVRTMPGPRDALQAAPWERVVPVDGSPAAPRAEVVSSPLPP